MIMEDSEGSPSTLVGFTERRRRSSKLRRPRDIKASLQSFTFMPSSTHVNIAPTNEANPSIRNGDSNCGSTSENKLKLKLKLGGGVTRTFQTNSEAGIYTKATVNLCLFKSFDFVHYHALVIVNLFLI